MRLKDALTDELVVEINQCFEQYADYYQSDNEWACNSYHQRLIGIMLALQSITGEGAELVMLTMMDVAHEDTYLPYEWEQVKKGDHRGCSH